MRISDWSSDVCSSDLADAWTRQHGGIAAATPAEAAKGADVVLTCVGNDDDLAQVTLGRDGAFKAMTKGALFIDHTTVSARIRSEEHTSELQSLMRISYAVFCLTKKGSTAVNDATATQTLGPPIMER